MLRLGSTSDQRGFNAPRFIAEGELARLSKNLRILGSDCAYDGGLSLPDAIAQALREDRILITLKPVASTEKLQVHKVASSEPRAQLLDIVDAFSLSNHFHPFSRCLDCNQPLSLSPAPDDDLPDSVLERKLPVFRCPQCGKRFWEGSHVHRMRQRLLEWGLTLTEPDRATAVGDCADGR